MSAVQTPPRAGLETIAARLDAAGIVWALGGSGLLAALGLVDRVNDWDLSCDADAERVRSIYAGVPYTFHGHGGCHADHKLAFEAECVEVIPRFAFFTPVGIVHIATRVTGTWEGIPLGQPVGWACAYWLMGEYDEPAQRTRRAQRALLLLDWLAAHGADSARLDDLLAQPLPDALRSVLAALPRR